MQRFPLTIALLLTGASWLPAQITADLAISQGGNPIGTITLELDHVKAPMATANFIGLASGELTWIDSATGVVRHHTPYYDGIIFHRVIKDFMNQTGSQNGQGTDGPGYSFPDGAETSNGLNHSSPFVISMANSGPNTNGSQIFLTAVPTTHLDGKHIVFGKVAEGASQTLVTTINNVATDGGDRPLAEVRIESVTVDYNGIDFDVHDQGLPVVTVPELASPVTPASTSLEFTQPAGTIVHVAHSGDLVSWTRLEERYLDDNDASLESFALPTGATGSPSHFYGTALVSYDHEIFFPSSLANKTLAAMAPIFSETLPIVFNFDATGQSAQWVYNISGGLSGTATLFGTYRRSPYGGNVTLILSGFPSTPSAHYWQFNDLIPDAGTSSEISGTHSLKLYSSTGNFLDESPSTFTLSK